MAVKIEKLFAEISDEPSLINPKDLIRILNIIIDQVNLLSEQVEKQGRELEKCEKKSFNPLIDNLRL